MADVHLALQAEDGDLAALEARVVAVEAQLRRLGGAPIRSEIRPFTAWMWATVPDPAELQVPGGALAVGAQEPRAWLDGWLGPPWGELYLVVEPERAREAWLGDVRAEVLACADAATTEDEASACFRGVAAVPALVWREPPPVEQVYAPESAWGYEDEPTFALRTPTVRLGGGTGRRLWPAAAWLPYPEEPSLPRGTIGQPRERERPPARDTVLLGPGCREVLVPRADPGLSERLARDLRARPEVAGAVAGQPVEVAVRAEVEPAAVAARGLDPAKVAGAMEAETPWRVRAAFGVVEARLPRPYELVGSVRPPGEEPTAGLARRRLVAAHGGLLRVDGTPVQSAIACPADGVDGARIEALAREVAMAHVGNERAISVGPVSTPLPWSPVPPPGAAPRGRAEPFALPAGPHRLTLAAGQGGCDVRVAPAARRGKAVTVGVIEGACPEAWATSGPADPDGALVIDAGGGRVWLARPWLRELERVTLPETATSAWFADDFRLLAFVEPSTTSGRCQAADLRQGGLHRVEDPPAGVDCATLFGIPSLRREGGAEGVVLDLSPPAPRSR